MAAKKRAPNKTSVAATRTGNWKPVFIQALRETGLVYRAAEIAHVNRRTANRERYDDPDFDEQWSDALEDYKESLEEEVDRQGKAGNIIGLMFRLKRLDPLYRDRIDLNINYPELFKQLVEKHRLSQEEIKGNPLFLAAATRWNALGPGRVGSPSAGEEKAR